MKLIPATGDPRMQKALSHQYVLSIVTILLQNYQLLRPVSRLLRKYDLRSQPGLVEDLDALRTNQGILNRAGLVTVPAHITELVQILYDFYQQPNEDIRYQRGAIVELLVYKLVSPRYRRGECLSNHRFIDERGHSISDQIDVAALSYTPRQLEGYECKLKVNGVDSADCTNLAYLAEVAIGQDFRANVGIVSFDDDDYMKRKLERLQPSPSIKVYGLNGIRTLDNSPF